MGFSFEIWITLGLIGFYLYDSAALVFSNEIVFFETKGRWFVALPTDRWRVVGKRLFFPNPLKPNYSMFIVPWSATASFYAKDSKDTFELISAIRYLRLAVVPLMLLLIFVLPLVIFKLGIGTPALITLMLVYLLVIAMLFYIYTKREKLGLSKRQVLSLAFEATSCPPFAINLIRKITIKRSIASCPLEFAFKVLEPQDFKNFAEELDKKLSEKMEYEIDHETNTQIMNYRKKIMSMIL
ncbi:hypothetical protein [Methylophilus luteus]|uniref:Uncharacterized protein n=1 Tax=Methylophilus luteus TaxID=640108 RepID=A0ABW3F883_9PROT